MIPQSSAFPKTYPSRQLFPMFPLFPSFPQKRPRIGQRFRYADQKVYRPVQSMQVEVEGPERRVTL